MIDFGAITIFRPNHALQRIPIPNRDYAIQFLSHWFYNIIGFGGRALSGGVR